MSEAEHRRDPRIAQGFMVRYRLPTEPSWSVSPLRDLSSSGARFLGERAFEIGAELELQLVLPISKEPLPLQARVARATPGSMHLIEYGVTFHVDEAKIQEMIDAAVAHFLRKQRKT